MSRQLAGRAPVVLAVDIGGTTMKGAVVCADGDVSFSEESSTPSAGGPAVTAALASLLGSLSEHALSRCLLPLAAGIVTPGVVDARSGVVHYASNLGWRDVPLRLLAEDLLGLPVAIDHDVRAAGLAESLLGAGRGVADFVFVNLGTGISAAAVSGGALIAGAGQAAGELGHVPTHPGGESCPCGQRGCLEAYASGAAIARRYRARGGEAGTTAKAIASAIGTDPVADDVWQEAVTSLGLALTTTTLLFDPALLVIGGGVSQAREALLAPLRVALSSQLAWREPPPVTISHLGDVAGRTGAAVLAMRVAGEGAAVANWKPELVPEC